MPFHTSTGADLRGLDARNRALRTFLQGLGIDLAVALAALILANVDSITTRQGLILFAIAAGKTVLTTVASYVMRRFLDPSSVPTPLPPSDPGEPDSDVALEYGDTGRSNVQLALVVAILLGVLLLLLAVFGAI